MSRFVCLLALMVACSGDNKDSTIPPYTEDTDADTDTDTDPGAEHIPVIPVPISTRKLPPTAIDTDAKPAAKDGAAPQGEPPSNDQATGQ